MRNYFSSVCLRSTTVPPHFRSNPQAVLDDPVLSRFYTTSKSNDGHFPRSHQYRSWVIRAADSPRNSSNSEDIFARRGTTDGAAISAG